MKPTRTDQEAFDLLSCYTLADRNPYFIHQLAVDAYAAQHADDTTKPIYAAFALAGLCLHNGHGFSGKEVQMAHIRLGRQKRDLPRFTLPPQRGDITVQHVLDTEPGPERDAAIERWSAATWQAMPAVHRQVEDWLRQAKEI